MVSWTSTGKLFIKDLGPVWAIPTTSRALVEDARSCPEAGTASPAWSESPKGADTRGELAPRTRSGRARMGLWEGDGHRSPLLCIVLPESALLAETRTDWHSAMGGRMHLCPETPGNSGRTRAGTGISLEKQRGPPPLCQTDSKSGIPKTACKPVQGAVYVGHYRHIVRSDYDMMLPENGEKIHQSQEDSPEFQAVYVPGKELSCPFPARRSAFEDRAPARHWCVRRDHMATVDRTHSHPALENSGVPPL